MVMELSQLIPHKQLVSTSLPAGSSGYDSPNYRHINVVDDYVYATSDMIWLS